MPCERCQGFLVEEREAYTPPELAKWRCVNCGHLVDLVMACHRTRQRAGLTPYIEPASWEMDEEPQPPEDSGDRHNTYSPREEAET